MSTKPARSINKLRSRLSEDEWSVYRTGMQSLATEASQHLANLSCAVEALRNELDDTADLFDDPHVRDEKLRTAHKGLNEKLGNLDNSCHLFALVERFDFEGETYSALTPLGKFVLALEKAVGNSNDLERRCTFLREGTVPAAS